MWGKVVMEEVVVWRAGASGETLGTGHGRSRRFEKGQALSIIVTIPGVTGSGSGLWEGTVAIWSRSSARCYPS